MFVDRSCAGKKIPEAFRELGFRVEVQGDHFAPEANDTEILDACGRNRWIYVAQDFAVRRNLAELEALVRAGIHAIFLRGRRRPAEWVIRNPKAARLKIVRSISKATTPIHIKVLANGDINILSHC